MSALSQLIDPARQDEGKRQQRLQSFAAAGDGTTLETARRARTPACGYTGATNP